MAMMSDIPFLDKGYPVMSYRFVVVIFTGLVPNPIDIEFKEVSGLKKSRNIGANAIRTSLENGSLPMQTLTLKRGVFTSLSPLIVGNLVEAAFWNTKLLRKDLLICCLDADDFPVNAWVITNAFLESWEWDGLNAGNNEVLVESMIFKFSNIQYLPLKVLKTVYKAVK